MMMKAYMVSDTQFNRVNFPDKVGQILAYSPGPAKIRADVETVDVPDKK